MAHISDYSIENQYKAKIKKSNRLTPQNVEEVRELLLEVQVPEFSCEVDQSFGVLVKTNNEFGSPYHHRLYSVADLPARKNGKTLITMLVKRCSYVDEFSGELYKGVGSNYLCDRKVGDQITITGPFELPFSIPDDTSANMLLIGIGTGIAPFRAFIKHIYKQVKDWKGKIRLFYGAKSGLELLYLNEKDGDLTNYYDKGTFKAFHAVSPRPDWNDPIALDTEMEKRSNEILKMLSQTNTYVYVAGHEGLKNNLDKAFSKIMGSEENWRKRKAELVAGEKWAEIIY